MLCFLVLFFAFCLVPAYASASLSAKSCDAVEEQTFARAIVEEDQASDTAYLQLLQRGGRSRPLASRGPLDDKLDASMLVQKTFGASASQKSSHHVKLKLDHVLLKKASGNEEDAQQKDRPKIRVACVGDSLTQVSSNGKAYPELLQRLLGDGYIVTNLGVAGKTVQKNGTHGATIERSPASYMSTPEFQLLRNSSWDIVVIQFGTNDVKEYNWNHKLCELARAPERCPFWMDYSEMISIVKSLGSPEIYLSVPPPVTRAGHEEVSTFVLHSILPTMIPDIAAANGICKDHVLDMFNALGGQSWRDVPKTGCFPNISNYSVCKYHCPYREHCDQIHFTEEGSLIMANVVAEALRLNSTC